MVFWRERGVSLSVVTNNGLATISGSQIGFKMNRMRINGFLALVLLCIAGRSLPLYGDSLNLLVNGSFEDLVVPEGSQCGPYANCMGFHNGVAGNDNIAGWQLIGKGGVDGNGQPLPDAPATILLLGYDYSEFNFATNTTMSFHPQHGAQSVDLTGEGNQGTTNGIKQSVGTTANTDYLLPFWVGQQYSFAPGYTGGEGFLALYVNGEIVGSFISLGITLDDVSWAPFDVRFTAGSQQTVIAFLNDTPYGNNYAGLDNVSLHQIPEPSSLMLVALGLPYLALMAARRRGWRSR
jgi:hypothetical protein